MAAPQVFRHALDNLNRLWRGIAAPFAEDEQQIVFAPQLSEDDARRLSELIRQCLEGRGGEVSARARAARLGRLYLGLDAHGKQRFLSTLAREFPADRAQLNEAATALARAEDDDAYLTAEEELRARLLSPRLRLLKHFNALPQGVKFLIDLRADLLRWTDGDIWLRSLDRELRQLLATWFDSGFLELRRITWDSPAALLEKLIAYEAVHEIRSWEDLRNRLESDRRCYAFFHPAMPDEPLIFIEVALVEGLADSIQELLDPQAPVTDLQEADTAIFYSISNAQKGLRGISFGDFLIKQVVDDLRHDLPQLKSFATLSPIPGLRRWLAQALEAADLDPGLRRLQQALDAAAERLGTPSNLAAVMDSPNWWEDAQLAELLREPLELLCLRYFHERRTDGLPLDPVERFHLGNGARIEKLDWLGDRSPKGMRQSCGLMVNYLYRLEDIEKNHEAFVGEKHIVTAKRLKHQLDLLEGDKGGPLRRLLKGRS
ncbi:malonyl-CoA decarboxylase [Geoalkalibacter halelectricus]|uniref:Malonyl-CoA decarboxylase n=1 Tax=Geoalkalibacter halelectricus TaxID=2847045 RepID=A0ABY5ZGC0_9BACT|nr:malonyl-CoA decarboxylase [Geoalkalibacter halelectricus]MDO3377900.1 malonyl-CoA decarboxylase [Geoalkalibacter halelectricus]UWZ77919.1 malonyl-CoA decarboxylase [Geoalkalibacter halelectricus]